MESQSHAEITNPEQQRREGEPSWHPIVGISGDLIHRGDSAHTIPDKKWFLCYNTSLGSSLWSVSARGASRQRSSQRSLIGTPRNRGWGALYYLEGLWAEIQKGAGQCVFGKRIGLSHLEHTGDIPPLTCGMLGQPHSSVTGGKGEWSWAGNQYPILLSLMVVQGTLSFGQVGAWAEALPCGGQPHGKTRMPSKAEFFTLCSLLLGVVVMGCQGARQSYISGVGFYPGESWMCTGPFSCRTGNQRGAYQWVLTMQL